MYYITFARNLIVQTFKATWFVLSKFIKYLVVAIAFTLVFAVFVNLAKPTANGVPYRALSPNAASSSAQRF
jgi:hypothetical protein